MHNGTSDCQPSHMKLNPSSPVEVLQDNPYRSEGFPNGIFHPCALWARGLARQKNCRRVVAAAVGVSWFHRGAIAPRTPHPLRAYLARNKCWQGNRLGACWECLPKKIGQEPAGNVSPKKQARSLLEMSPQKMARSLLAMSPLMANTCLKTYLHKINSFSH